MNIPDDFREVAWRDSSDIVGGAYSVELGRNHVVEKRRYTFEAGQA